jgi:hypothetical protein
MKRLLFSFPRRVTLSVVAGAMLVWQGCTGCPPVKLKTIDIPASNFATGTSGISGSMGWCLSAGHPPGTTFSPGPGQIMVGFDDYFKSGTPPFPCNDIRDAVFRAGVLFDVSQFDSIVSADFLFDGAASAERSNGETVGQVPPKSFATTLGVGTQTFTPSMPDDNEVSLPTGPNIDVGVTSQVRDWVNKTRPNFGFVVWGPRGPVDPSSPQEDNDAQVTWYGNLRLRVTYNPAQNQRAPQ